MQKRICKGFAGGAVFFWALFLGGCHSNSSLQSMSNSGQSAAFQICPKLSFNNVTWSSSLTATDQKAMELALDISGSYEGASGWANLANNFDGQGFSLGLLNQNLGVGSLQPLLVQMRNGHSDVLEKVFDATRLQSLLGMLSQWESVSAAQVQTPTVLSIFDFPVGLQSLTAANTDSVTWAADNLYTGTDFQSNWRTELTALAETPEYISIQIAAAYAIHAQAIAEEQQAGVDELRAYLFMFDINVQNGSMYPQDFIDYNAYLTANPKATDTDRLNELLQLRLRHVDSQYVTDVESRKETIINGVGTVYGSARNLPSEFCYNSLFAYH